MPNKPEGGPRLLTAEEVARQLRLHEGRRTGMQGAVRSVHRLRRLHDIPAIRIGRRVMFTQKSVQRLLDACSISGSGDATA